VGYSSIIPTFFREIQICILFGRVYCANVIIHILFAGGAGRFSSMKNIVTASFHGHEITALFEGHCLEWNRIACTEFPSVKKAGSSKIGAFVQESQKFYE
jgi:hypothetical protein